VGRAQVRHFQILGGTSVYTMITGITLSAYRQKSFFHFLPKLNPKPDIWIIYNDVKPSGDWDLHRFEKVANNYNNACSVIPDNTQYVLLMEDDAIVPYNALQIHLDNIKETKSDGNTFPFYARNPWDDLGEKIHYAELMIADFYNDKKKNELRLVTQKDRTGLKKITTTSFNFVLLKKKVIDDVKFTSLNKKRNLYIDNIFFLEASKRGFVIHCNYDVRTYHVGSLVWHGKIYENGFSDYEKGVRKDIFNLPITSNEPIWIFTFVDVLS
jgi:hypothetical protein